MNADYILACGIVWRKTADPEAGWQVVEALESHDLRVRVLAQTFLVGSGEQSMRLLESAVAAGEVRPEIAGPCMAEILQNQQVDAAEDQSASRHVFDIWQC